jgi:S-(hydroxymethyl)glutathione dehydrogenase / alcohol dehydrogenase
MKAVVFHRPKRVQVDTVDDPRIEDPKDLILRVTSTAICGSDLHIYNGLFPQPRPQVLGHEFMGVVEEIGSDVRHVAVGQRVVVPFPISCGECFFCSHGSPVSCERSNPDHYGPDGGITDQKGGGLYGYTDLYGGYGGGQAEYVRVRYADVNPRVVPDDLTDEQVLFLSDIFPTGWAAVDWCDPRGGETVAVYGCGPVGVMAQKAAWLRGARRVFGIDVQPYRLDIARRAARSETIDARDGDSVERLRAATEGRGPDAVIDAVGLEPDRTWLEKLGAAVHLQRGSSKVFEECVRAVRRGGVVSVVGVYATSYDNFPWGRIFDKGLRIRAGQAPVQNSIDHLFELVREQRVRLDDIITHRLPLADAPRAYEIFNGKQDGCEKVVLKP